MLIYLLLPTLLFVFFLNATAPPLLYTLSYTTLFRSPAPRHPRARRRQGWPGRHLSWRLTRPEGSPVKIARGVDRKSTRLNSSHQIISYAVFCLKKKNSWTTLIVHTPQ